MSTKTVTITPTWKQIIPMMLLCWENPDLKPSSRHELRIEFDRLAEAADKYNDMQATNAEAIAKVSS